MQDNASTRMQVEKQTVLILHSTSGKKKEISAVLMWQGKQMLWWDMWNKMWIHICSSQHRTWLIVLGNTFTDRCRLVKRRALTKFRRSENLERHGCEKILSKLQDWKEKVPQPWNKFFHIEQESKPFCPVHGENNKQMLIIAAREIKVRYEEKFSDHFYDPIITFWLICFQAVLCNKWFAESFSSKAFFCILNCL